MKLLPEKTPYTKGARENVKNFLKLLRKDTIQIWNLEQGFVVITKEFPGMTYHSTPFPSKLEAFIHIFSRGCNTGNDLKRFNEVAIRYFRRFPF